MRSFTRHNDSIIKRLFIAIAMLAALPCFITAQDTEDLIKVETDLVVFEVTVYDRQGQPVAGQQREDFLAFENGVEKPIDFFQNVSSPVRPLSIVFCLDISGSMTGEEIAKLSDSVNQLIERFDRPDAYFASIAFSMQVKKLSGFTNDAVKIRKAFGKLNSQSGGLSTHAYDAIDYAVRMTEKDSPKKIRELKPKRSIVVISDGFPVGDIVRPSTVIERANKAGISVYTIILPSYSRLSRGRRPVITPLEISGIAKKTGGRDFYAVGNDIEPVFAELAKNITSSYAVAFYPAEAAGEPGRRRVEIRSKHGYRVVQNRDFYEIDNE